MFNKNSTGFDEEGLGFDPITFARGIYDTIDQYRSQLPRIPNEVITSPSEVGAGGSQGENRINTFFRLLGLPASRNENIIKGALGKDLTDIKDFALLSYDETINYLSSLNVDTELTARNDTLSQPVLGARFNELLHDPLYLLASITKNSRRAQLFPLVVDAAIPIYPIDRRVAPLFYGKDYTTSAGEVRLSRPFIEYVIYIRTKVLSGFKDDIVFNSLKQNIDDVLPGDLSVDNILDSTVPSVISAYIVQKFIQTIGKLVDEFITVRQTANQAIKEISYNPGYVSNPEQRSGDSSTTEQKAADGFALDEAIRDIKRVLAEKEAMIFLLPTDYITKADQARRQTEELNIRNVKADVFISHFTDIITYEANDLRQQLAAAEAERERKIQAIEIAKRDLMYYTGEFTGLSIFDIICVFYALFTVDLKYIVGLLNQDALSRFKADPFFASSNQASDGTLVFKSIADILPGGNTEAASITDSLNALEAKIKEAFSIAVAFEAQKSETQTSPNK